MNEKKETGLRAGGDALTHIGFKTGVAPKSAKGAEEWAEEWEEEEEARRTLPPAAILKEAEFIEGGHRGKP